MSRTLSLEVAVCALVFNMTSMPAGHLVIAPWNFLDGVAQHAQVDVDGRRPPPLVVYFHCKDILFGPGKYSCAGVFGPRAVISAS